MNYSWLPYFPCNAILCRYNEIGTKGRNRGKFEESLRRELRRRLSPLGEIQFNYERGRIFILPAEGKETFSEEDLVLLREESPLIAGVSSVSPGFLLPTDFAAIEAKVNSIFPKLYASFSREYPDKEITYAMRVRRTHKAFPMESKEIEIHFAQELVKSYPDLKIDLRNAELLLELEIRPQHSFLFWERTEGAGGLPVGSGGKLLALLSGGFDSPVACYQMFLRGCNIDFLTFHSSPYTPPATLSKVADLVKRLNQLQIPGKLFAVNLLPAQKEIRDKCQSRYRTILYRRMMLRIAEKLAYRQKAKALLTGDNLGQVASQTLDNMAIINNATEMLILRPLLAAEKVDTINLAQKIGTYDISIEDVPDSCTVFATNDPATKALLRKVIQDEEKLNIPELLQECFNTLEIIPT